MGPDIVSSVVEVAVDVGGAIAKALIAQLGAGDVSALESLRPVLTSSGQAHLIDAALVAGQRAKAAKELAP